MRFPKSPVLPSSCQLFSKMTTLDHFPSIYKSNTGGRAFLERIPVVRALLHGVLVVAML